MAAGCRSGSAESVPSPATGQTETAQPWQKGLLHLTRSLQQASTLRLLQRQSLHSQDRLAGAGHTARVTRHSSACLQADLAKRRSAPALQPSLQASQAWVDSHHSCSVKVCTPSVPTCTMLPASRRLCRACLQCWLALRARPALQHSAPRASTAAQTTLLVSHSMLLGTCCPEVVMQQLAEPLSGLEAAASAAVTLGQTQGCAAVRCLLIEIGAGKPGHSDWRGSGSSTPAEALRPSTGPPAAHRLRSETKVSCTGQGERPCLPEFRLPRCSRRQ